MAKKPEIKTIASGYYSRQALNTNFENLRDKFDNTLSLDGSTPNAMGADLDVNGNNILNAGQIDTDTLLIGGVSVSPSGDVNFETTYLTASYVGDGSTVAYSLTANPQTENNVNVYVDGVYQNKDTFALSGTTVTFSEAPPLNAAIEIVYPTNTDTLNGSTASAITYNQGGTGAQDRTVKAKLQEFVSVKDFGAVGDGVTDDTAAIQAAINWASSSKREVIFFPSGRYKCGTIYMTYDASLNPNFDNSNNNLGSIILRGEGGHPSESAASNWESASPGAVVYKNTRSVIESTATTTSAIVMSTPSQGTLASGYPVRNQQIQNMLIQANTTAYVVENNGAPDRSGLEDVTLIQSNAAGNGLLWKSSWYTFMQNVSVLTTQSARIAGQTGDGMVLGTTTFAGLFTFIDCDFSGFLNGVKITDANYMANTTFINCGFQKNDAIGCYIYNTNLKNISFRDCYFEYNDNYHIKVETGSSSVQNVQIHNCFMLGETAGPDTYFIYLDKVRSADISNVNFWRAEADLIYNQGDASADTGFATVVRNCVRDDSGYTPSANYKCVVGSSQAAMPMLINNRFPETANWTLYDTATRYEPTHLKNNTVGALGFNAHGVFRRDMDTTSELDTVGDNEPQFRVYNCTAAGGAVEIPQAFVDEGRMYYIANSDSSTQSLLVKRVGGSPFATLAAGDAAVVIGDKSTNQCVAFTTTFTEE